jgi:hypothetical protein
MINLSSAFEDRIAEPDQRLIRLQLLRPLQECLEPRIVIVRVVAFLGRNDVEHVILDSIRRLTASRDAREATFLKKAPRGEVVPDRYFLGHKHGLELCHPVGCDAKDDGDALHFARV